jgi:broad specificity phosphatase PhoE
MKPSAMAGQNANWSNQMRRCTFTTRLLARRSRIKLSTAAFRADSAFHVKRLLPQRPDTTYPCWPQTKRGDQRLCRDGADPVEDGGMAMPNDLVLVRHGESEANIIQKADKEGSAHPKADLLNDRPDWQQRLSPLGIKQAIQAKTWIDDHLSGAGSFDARYVSPFLRARETAAYLGGEHCGGWTVDDRIAERSWGVYGIVPRPERRSQFPLTKKLHDVTPWYVRFDGGESMPDVYGRFRDFQGTLHREHFGQRVLLVSHGDFINVARYGVERMLPEEWEAMDRNPRYTLRNCSITHYSRVNPSDPFDVRDKLRWRRMVYTDTFAESPDGGEWVEVPARRRYTGGELLAQADIAPRVI